MPQDLHFLNPEWLLALLPLAVLLGIAGRQAGATNAWQRVVDPKLLPYLLMGQSGAARWLPLALLGLGWLLAVIALANPSYERRPVPAIRPLAARVVVMDLSRSMEAADLKPSRLARARYKVADILGRSRDGQVGLVAFAGEAFVVAPLSDDADTLLAMLDALSPDVMPVRGSRPDLGLAKAAELLTQAGARAGEVVLVGDDPGDERAIAAARALVAEGRTLSVIGVGTSEGAPVPGARDTEGRPVMARLDVTTLAALAEAGGGAYATLNADGQDLDLVLHRQTGGPHPVPTQGQAEADQWDGLGPWLALGLLPLAALAFRRGWLMSAALTLFLAHAALTPAPALAWTWDDLWQRRDQQVAAAMAQGDHRRALDLADQPAQRGTASYRLGDYRTAAEAFAAAGGAEGDYNRGNALALAGRLQEAIAAYNAALSREPEMEDARYNKARVEELLRQQQQQPGPGDQSPEEQERQSPQGQEGQQDQTGDPKGGEQGDQGQQAQDGQGGQAAQQGEETQAGQQGQDGDQGQEGAGAGGQDQAAGAKGGAEDQQGQAGIQPGEEDAPDAAGAEARRAQAEQAAADYRAAAEREAVGQGEAGAGPQEIADPGTPGEADPTPEELEARQAAEQWLRRIPDDPSGLLRRKFLYQYRLRNMQQGTTTSGNPW